MVRQNIAQFSISTLLISASFLTACGDDEAVPTAESSLQDVAEVAVGDGDAVHEGGQNPGGQNQRTAPAGTSTVDDTRIATAVLMRLVADREIDARNFDVMVLQGNVSLNVADGTPSDIAQRALAIAQEVDGVVAAKLEGAGVQTAPASDDAAAVEELVVGTLEQGPFDDAPGNSIEEVIDAPAEVATPAPPVVEAPAAQPEAEVPAQAPVQAPTPAAGGNRPYEVKRGESLSVIAARQLGDGSRWNEIYQMNRDVIGPNPDGVRAGMTIMLPPRRD